jgi:hypothetical protein
MPRPAIADFAIVRAAALVHHRRPSFSFLDRETIFMDDKRPVLTTRQGHPVTDNQALRSVGERGPATL